MNRDNLKTDLLEFLDSHPAHVDAKKAFQDLKPENRHKRVENFSHTIWEELEHLRLAQEDILRYMLEPDWKSPKWPEGYWPTEKESISDEEWEKSLSGFFADLKETQEFIKNSNVDLIEKIPHTKNHTYLREILLIIDHNAYHLGKIIEMRKALNNW
jgi:uncharacterized damage-inducible protein DinB